MTFKHKLPDTQKSHKNGTVSCYLVKRVLSLIERHLEKRQLEVSSNSIKN